MIGQSGQLVQSHVTMETKRELEDLSETEAVKGLEMKQDYVQDLHADVCHQMSKNICIKLFMFCYC